MVFETDDLVLNSVHILGGDTMSDYSQGPGWWQATDGKWYPPDATAAGQGAFAPVPSSGQDVDAKGFVRSLYDFKLDHFVTPKVLRFIYAIVVILLSLGAVLFLLAGLSSGDSSSAVAALIGVPIAYFLYLVFTRIYFELIAAFFHIHDDVRAIRRNNRS